MLLTVTQKRVSGQDFDFFVTNGEGDLWLLVSEDVNPGSSFAFFCIHRDDYTPVAATFKLVKASPMFG